MRKLARFGLLLFAVALLSIFVPYTRATIFGSIRGIVHDPQHRPVGGATVMLKSATSDWTQRAQTDPDGSFAF